MSVYVGNQASIMIHGNFVTEMGLFELSGFTREMVDKTAFGDDISKWTFLHGDGGEIIFAGHYDAEDITGQHRIEIACDSEEVFQKGDLRLYIDDTNYLTVDTGGYIMITTIKNVGVDKAGIGTIGFKAIVSSADLVLDNAAIDYLVTESGNNLITESGLYLILN